MPGLGERLPSPYAIRRGGSSDAAPIDEMYSQAWWETYIGLLPDAVNAEMVGRIRRGYLSGLVTSGAQALWMAEDEAGRVVGLVACGPLACESQNAELLQEKGGQEKGMGEIHALYVLRQAQGNGVGRRLALQAARYLRQAGYKRAQVRVFAGNRPARRFYECFGGVEVETVRRDFCGTMVQETRYIFDLESIPGL